ncbi:MAG: glycosyltransferase family 39 protein [Actinobacteria bacterium]|nr:glycosyltransferase family 39 protein [Actinomycetota bacterium]
MRRLLHGPEADPRWARPALFGLLGLTAVLYLWNLTRNGWGNDFYAAAVQAGTKSWKAFFFGSFDQSNFITVDKTPASLWVMEISGRIFGFSQWSMLAPQALEGVASVALLYAAVKRWFGPAAGLIAVGVLALTPVAALMFRFNNPDALLVALMTAAAYALVRAIDNGRTKWLVLCGVLLGFAFLAKMLQAFLVVPGFAVAYLWAGPPRLGRRICQTVLLGAGILAGAGWWILAAELTPAASRPYFGGSATNNILQLAIGYNGLGRLTGDETGSVGGGNGPGGRGGGPGGGGFGGASGVLRLFHSEFGGQISWLLPAALISLGAMLWVSRRAARTDRTRAAALLWGGWVLVTGLVFSYMNGIIHPYYMVALAPGVAVLAGIGATALCGGVWGGRPPGTALCGVWGDRRPGTALCGGIWEDRRPGATRWWPRPGLAGRIVAAAGIVVSAAWAYVLLDRTPQWLPWLRWVVLVTGVAAAGAVLAAPRMARMASAGRSRRGRLALAVMPLGLALVAGLAGPAAYALDTVSSAHSGSIPTAGPQTTGFGGPGGGQAGLPGGQTGFAGGQAGFPGGQAGAAAGGVGGRGTGAAGGPGGLSGDTTVSGALTKLLEQDASRYKWVAATEGSQEAAPLELATGDAVMAIGGFNGTDPWPTLAVFEELVAKHEIHYYVGRNTQSFGGGQGSSAIAAWVAAHFKKVTVGGQTVYDLTQPVS